MENAGLENYTPDELKKLNIEQAEDYCKKIRNFLIENISVTGGHLASNLGICEISVALIRVFSPPHDKIIYDVGHQSYVHKILTGRLEAFDTIRNYNGLSGFTKMSESAYDAFGAGHSSTSISAALGYAKAAKLSGEDYYSIALIGDGAFTGGLAYEGLNNCEEDDNIIIILNENEMSISKNVGKFSRYFLKIRTKKGYFQLKHHTEKVLKKIPVIGRTMISILGFFKTFMRRLVTNSNMFEQLGIRYYGPADGNDLETVELLLNEAKKNKGPSFIHLCTKKGKGYKPAEDNPCSYHSVLGSCALRDDFKSMSRTFGDKIVEIAKSNDKICAITAAMGDGVGFNTFEKKFPDRFYDVGIAEAHAITFAAALAAAGYLPVVSMYSTFFQRAYDQFIHDVALQNLKIILTLDHAGIVGEDGPTHHGVFDVSMLLNVPGIEIYSPSSNKELECCLEKAEKSDHTTVIRYPKFSHSELVDKSFEGNARNEFYSKSKKPEVLIVTYGKMCHNALYAAEILSKKGIDAAVFKVTRLKPFDITGLTKVLSQTAPYLVYILEEGMKIGGFGEYIASLINGYNIYIKAIKDEFITFGNCEKLYDVYGFSGEKIACEIYRMRIMCRDNEESRFTVV